MTSTATLTRRAIRREFTKAAKQHAQTGDWIAYGVHCINAMLVHFPSADCALYSADLVEIGQRYLNATR